MNSGQKILLGALIPMMGVPIALLMDREPPFKLEIGRTIPPEVTPGEPYRFMWRLTPLGAKSCDGRVNWRIVDLQGTIWTTPEDVSLFAEIRAREAINIVGRERILPNAIAPGPAIFTARMDFVCNFMHRLWPIAVEYPAVLSTVRLRQPAQ